MPGSIVITVHDVLIHLGSACDVVRLHSEHLLKRVRSTVCFQRPDLHFTKSLTTELGFPPSGCCVTKL